MPPEPDGATPDRGLARQGWSRALLPALIVAALAVATAGWFRSDQRSDDLAERLVEVEARSRAARDDLAELRASGGSAARIAPGAQAVFTLLTAAERGSAWGVQSGGARTLLATAYHVVQPTWERGDPSVALEEPGRSLAGEVVAVHPEADLALVAVEADTPVLALAGGEPAVGQAVTVVGSPLGFARTVSSGIVSALRPGEIQLSAPVSPGSSGGPVLDSRGEVVALVGRKVTNDSAEGIAFATPVNRLCERLLDC